MAREITYRPFDMPPGLYGVDAITPEGNPTTGIFNHLPELPTRLDQALAHMIRMGIERVVFDLRSSGSKPYDLKRADEMALVHNFRERRYVGIPDRELELLEATWKEYITPMIKSSVPEAIDSFTLH